MDRFVNNVRHWRGRREVAKVINNSGGREETSNSALVHCIEILENCPELAELRFAHYRVGNKMNIYPLSFLLMNGASLEDIRKVHSCYPEAACRKVTPKNIATDYPLHLACVLGGVSEELILFLAWAYPQAVAIKNSSGSLPIHVLLRNARHELTLDEVKTLLHLYEEARGLDWGECTQNEMGISRQTARGDWRQGNNDYGAALSLAIRNENVSRPILDLLVSKFPTKTCDTFYLGRATPDFSVGFFLRQNVNYTMSEPRMRSLCPLLSCLKIFSCTAKNWSIGGFRVLMMELCSNESLVELTFSFPPSLMRDDDAAIRGLQEVLQKNTTLQRLHIDFPAFCKGMQVEKVETAANKGFQTNLKLFLETLQHNTALRELHLSGDLVALLDSGFRCSEF